MFTIIESFSLHYIDGNLPWLPFSQIVFWYKLIMLLELLFN